MRYRLPTERLINQLTPHYLPGRKYILFLQSLVYPLQTLNDRFVAFAREKQIDARMTGQIIYFEWYLNRKFRQHFLHPGEAIYIAESESEEKIINSTGFTVCVPEITTDEQAFVYMLSYVVNSYKLAGKTFLIKIAKTTG